MNSDTVVALTVLGILAAAAVIYATVRMLIARHKVFNQVREITEKLDQKRKRLTGKWESLTLSRRIGDITYVPPEMAKEAETQRDEIDAKLDELFAPTLRAKIAKLKAAFLDQKGRRLEIIGPADWPFWLFWQLVYALFAALDGLAYLVVLALPPNRMVKLHERLEFRRTMEQELDSAIKWVQQLTHSSKFLTAKKQEEYEAQEKAKKEAEALRERLDILKGLRKELLDSVEYHNSASPEEIIRGSTLLDLEEGRKVWSERFSALEQSSENKALGLEDADELIAAYQNLLSVFKPFSVVVGSPALSDIQRYADKVAEAEKFLQSCEQAFQERLNFSAIEGVTPQEPPSLRKARQLLVEACSHWASFEFAMLSGLANAANDLINGARKTVDDIKSWESLILAFERRRADIKENEDALAAYDVKLPQTKDWKEAIGLLEKEVPQAWASLDWEGLLKLHDQINKAFSARDQAVNRRLEVERDKRVAKGKKLPEGARARKNGSSVEPEGVFPNGPNQQTETGRRGLHYAPDPNHSGNLVWVRSKVSGMLLRVDSSLVRPEEYTIVSPSDPEVVELLRSQNES
jgi:hypothetical protein